MISPSRMIRFVLPALLLNTTLAVTLSAQSALDQRFLIPILSYSNWPGAFGSIWHGELTLFNASDNPVKIELQVCPPVISMCVPRADLPPHRSAKPAVYSATGSEGGFLYIATADVPNVTFKFRVRDLSRQSQTWGTEIPLVSLTEFRQLIRLIDVPSDSRFRVKLRVYSAGATPSSVHVRVYKRDALSPVSESDVTLAGIAGYPTGLEPRGPAYGELDPVQPALSDAGGTLRLEIEQRIPGEPPIWAFASVTNNETQHVTLITP